jgi:hypothetical protein
MLVTAVAAPAAAAACSHQQIIGLGIVILLDCITLALAMWLFLSPLEAMGKRIRGGQQVALLLIYILLLLIQ